MSHTSGLSVGGFEMLRAAVNAARQFQCRSVSSLKGRLLSQWPDRGEDINEAIDYWAGSVRMRHPRGVPSVALD
ncbi:hypothetical protein [Ralstonia sp. ASV6]|uniref:hypothetical protein n=1 Tax=Ralstonia sp. ASV6 TaxID=2795124 RepID=UPI0018EB62BC|nr:hypothetical protein [Ralstonia sp. ASV6]